MLTNVKEVVKNIIIFFPGIKSPVTGKITNQTKIRKETYKNTEISPKTRWIYNLHIPESDPGPTKKSVYDIKFPQK